MRFNRIIALISTLFLIKLGFAQYEESALIIEQLGEALAEDLGENYDYDQLTNRLLFYHQYRIDLNKTQGDELKELQFLSPLQIENFLNHRKQAGKFLSIYELQSIDGFDFLTFQRLLPFITISETQSIKDLSFRSILDDGKHDLMLRYGRTLQLSEGFRRTKDSGLSRYMGNPDRYFIRYRYQLPENFQIAINMKKDPGEPFFSGAKNHGFDFYSASLNFYDLGKIKNLVLGDYSLQFGQGVNLWSGLSFGKGSLLQNVARHGLGARPYTSTNEVLFLRGITGAINLNKFEITPFISYRRLDATIDEIEGTFSALNSSGYNRTESELANRRAVRQLLYGMNVKYKFDKLDLGINFYQTRFNRTLVPAQRLYNQFNFTGDRLINASIYYNYSLGGTYAFGETAHVIQGGLASVNGLISTLSHDLSVVLLHRAYQRNYFSFYNQAFAESSDAKNENGFYSGLLWSPNQRVSWVVYADYFRFPWLKFRVDAPSHGYDLFSLFTYSPDKKTEASIRYRFRKKQENVTAIGPVNFLSNVLRHQVRWEMKYAFGENFSFRNRFELASYQKEKERNELGLMFYQDLIYKPMASVFSGNVRFAVFKTDSYNSRIYAFENDVLYGYSFPAYANKGIRFYTNLRYKLRRNTDIWFRYAVFLFSERDIGSGLDAIEGKVKSDIRLQIRVQI